MYGTLKFFHDVQTVFVDEVGGGGYAVSKVNIDRFKTRCNPYSDAAFYRGVSLTIDGKEYAQKTEWLIPSYAADDYIPGLVFFSQDTPVDLTESSARNIRAAIVKMRPDVRSRSRRVSRDVIRHLNNIREDVGVLIGAENVRKDGDFPIEAKSAWRIRFAYLLALCEVKREGKEARA